MMPNNVGSCYMLNFLWLCSQGMLAWDQFMFIYLSTAVNIMAKIAHFVPKCRKVYFPVFTELFVWTAWKKGEASTFHIFKHSRCKVSLCNNIVWNYFPSKYPACWSFALDTNDFENSYKTIFRKIRVK